MDEITETLLYNYEDMTKLKCPKCGNEDIMLHEWMGAYDGWLALECHSCRKQFHRTNMKEIVEQIQPTKYGPVFFKTKGKEFFKNLHKIDEDLFDKHL